MNLTFLFKLLQTLEQLRKHDNWTRAHVQQHQARELRLLREYAYAHSPFYREFHRGLMDRPLSELPVLTKAAMMDRFDDLVTDRAIRVEDVRAHMAQAGAQSGTQLYLGRYIVNATSGSSGQPGIFLFDPSEWLAIVASFARAREWAGVRASILQRMKMASVASTDPWHMSAAVGDTVRSWWMPTLRLAAAEPLSNIVEQLNDWQPEMLVCYASMARLLASEQTGGRLHIAPRLVFASSEVLSPDTRRLIEAAWGVSPFNEYAATETGGIAAECAEHHALHLFEDLLIVEVVDERNCPVPPGKYGDKLLVTVLASRTQPLIRYELSDSVSLSENTCRCGRPFSLVADISGRTEQMLYFPESVSAGARSPLSPGDALSGRIVVHPNVFHGIMDRVPASGWQIAHEADGGLTILISGLPDGFDEARLAGDVAAALATRGVNVNTTQMPYVHVHRVPAIPRTAAGKAPLVLSRYFSPDVEEERAGR
jgi:putative adenylate-forming enzyme